jgi:hypothetical protein
VAVSGIVNPAPIRYTIGTVSQTYGRPANLAIDLPRTFNTGINGETLSILRYFSSGDTATAKVGQYAITGTVSDGTGAHGGKLPNYQVTLNSGTLIVTKASPAVRVVDAGGTYKHVRYAATATVAGVNGLYGSSLEGVTPKLTYYAGTYTLANLPAGGSSTAPSTAGSYTVVAFFPGSTDYGTARAVAHFAIARATLTVTASNASRIYGADNPAFTYTFNGFASGDSSSVVSGTPTLTTTATANSPPGRYPIVAVPGTLSAANYTFTLVNGTLTVLPAPVSAGIFTWIGVTSGDWFTATNWSTEAVPSPAATVVIQDAAFLPILGADATVSGVVMDGGSLTLDANLTDTGAFTQSGGTVNLNSNQLQVAGNVTRTAGTIPGTTGTLVLDGTAGQNFTDTSFTHIPNLTISNPSAAGVTLPGGSNVSTSSVTLNSGSTLTLLQGAAASFLFDSGTFTDNGKIVLSQLSPNGGNTTSLIKITGALAFGSGNSFDLSVFNPSVNAVFTFVTYGSTTGALGTVTIHGNAPFAATPGVGASALTVTLTSLGTIDTWLGGTDRNFANPANWSTGAAPGAADRAVIRNAPNDPILSAATTVGSLQVSGGYLTLNATLTVTGTYSQDAGFLAFASDAVQLQIAGDVSRTGGVFLGTAGTVVLNGAAQSVTDRSGHAFGWNLVVNSGDTVSVQAGSVVSVGNDFTNNGTVNLSMALPTSATPLVVGHNLVEGSGSVFNLTLGDTSAGLAYIFITFGGTDPTGATITTNVGTVNHNSNNISVTT